jgi:hypothetical protein
MKIQSVVTIILAIYKTGGRLGGWLGVWLADNNTTLWPILQAETGKNLGCWLPYPVKLLSFLTFPILTKSVIEFIRSTNEQTVLNSDAIFSE